MANELAHGEDQVFALTKDTIHAIESEVDAAIENAIRWNSPEVAFRFGRSLAATGYLRGVQLARFLWQLEENWDSLRRSDEDDLQDAVLNEMGVAYSTFRQYSDVYRHVLRPHPEMIGKPIRGLVRLIAAAREEEFSDEDWEELAACHDVRCMIAIRDRVRGRQTSSSNRLDIWRSRNGQLYCQRGEDGEIKQCGYLPPRTGDDDIDQAVTRMMSVGVMQR